MYPYNNGQQGGNPSKTKVIIQQKKYLIEQTIVPVEQASRSDNAEAPVVLQYQTLPTGKQTNSGYVLTPSPTAKEAMYPVANYPAQSPMLTTVRNVPLDTQYTAGYGAPGKQGYVGGQQVQYAEGNAPIYQYGPPPQPQQTMQPHQNWPTAIACKQSDFYQQQNITMPQISANQMAPTVANPSDQSSLNSLAMQQEIVKLKQQLLELVRQKELAAKEVTMPNADLEKANAGGSVCAVKQVEAGATLTGKELDSVKQSANKTTFTAGTTASRPKSLPVKEATVDLENKAKDNNEIVNYDAMMKQMLDSLEKLVAAHKVLQREPSPPKHDIEGKAKLEEKLNKTEPVSLKSIESPIRSKAKAKVHRGESVHRKPTTDKETKEAKKSRKSTHKHVHGQSRPKQQTEKSPCDGPSKTKLAEKVKLILTKVKPCKSPTANNESQAKHRLGRNERGALKEHAMKSNVSALTELPTKLMAPADYENIYHKETQPGVSKVVNKTEPQVEKVPSDAPTALIAPDDYVHLFNNEKQIDLNKIAVAKKQADKDNKRQR